ncbi:GNAT family N-acetyltransferase [Shewanella sp. YIC-542]|uniref:GNAT family N-acetyltransferase n=1 Tax=Shewanella mytili TaxID=3377111 RepID=UPI00398E9043
MSSHESLCGERIHLRWITSQDWPVFLQINQDVQVNRYIREVEPQSVIAARFALCTQGPGLAEGEWQALVIESLHGDFIGLIGLCLTDDVLQQWELGYLLMGHQQGKGYATEAMRLILPWLMATQQVHKVVARCVLPNVASARVLQKCGFQQEGVLRQHCQLRGEWQDECYFGLLAEDYRIAVQSW